MYPNTTAKRYLDAFEGSYMVRCLPPWHENLGKRIIKSPKTYIRDSGILHGLLGLKSFEELEGHPELGDSWEGFVLEQILHQTSDTRDAYFWATHAGAELDLLLIRGARRFGFQIQYSDAPRKTKSMSIALEALGLESLHVIYPGERVYDLSAKIKVLPLRMLDTIEAIF